MIDADLLKALDPVRFAESIGIKPDPWQAEVLRFEGKRMILNCSRQSGKSTTTAIKALHTAIYRPKSLILITSPSLRQSQELFRKINDFKAELPEPLQLIEDNKLSITLKNNSRILALASDAGTIRGYSGVTMILEDEASQVSDELYTAILPMLIINKGQLISMSTPFGKRGHFYEEWVNGGEDWKRIQIPASLCPRMSPEDLEKQKNSMGDLFYRQEFECQFVDNVEQTFNFDAVQRAFSDDIETLSL